MYKVLKTYTLARFEPTMLAETMTTTPRSQGERDRKKEKEREREREKRREKRREREKRGERERDCAH
jgi:hypothetical protein